jgi:hypothetical protein
MNIQNIDAVLAQILVSASKLEDFQEREMGPIHFIKYLYLADLFFAEKTGGRTFTGVRWHFHHFGPWDTAVYAHLDSGLASLGAERKTISSQYGHDDYVRWRVGTSAAQRAAENLDVEIALFIDQMVWRFTNNTPDLLDYVYKTPPMLKATPEEELSLEPSGFSFNGADVFTRVKPAERTARQKKKLKEWEDGARANLAEKLKEIRSRHMIYAPTPEPRYDDVFFEAMASMDAPDTPAIPPKGKYTAKIDASVWKSNARKDGDVS